MYLSFGKQHKKDLKMLNVKKDLKNSLYDITHYEGTEDVTFCDLLEQLYYDTYCESKAQWIENILDVNEIYNLNGVSQNLICEDGYEEQYKVWEERVEYSLSSKLSEKDGLYTFVLNVTYGYFDPDDNGWNRTCYNTESEEIIVLETDDKSEITKYLGELFDMLGIKP